jgi:hypothetical protein
MGPFAFQRLAGNQQIAKSSSAGNQQPSEDEELARTQKAYDRACMAQKLTRSKILKNDIRRYFARMYMNSMNSGELSKINGFHRTFMTGPCPFVAEYEATPELLLPDKLTTVGPLLMTHYVMGCFVQFPDLVLSMTDSRIVTSSNWAGSKIVMDMTLSGTKTGELDRADWIPEVAQLYRLCYTALAEKAEVKAVGVKKRRTAAAAITPTGAVEEPSYTSATIAPEKSDVRAVADGALVSSDTTEPQCCTKETNATSLANTAPDAPSARRKKRHGKYVKKSPPEVPLEFPQNYIHTLFAKVRPMPQPVQMVLHGTISLFLDERNYVHHMSLDMRQTNR